MQARQLNISMSKSMETALMVEDETIRTIQMELVKEAYKKPVYPSEQSRQKAIRDFENKWYLTCTEVMGE